MSFEAKEIEQNARAAAVDTKDDPVKIKAVSEPEPAAFMHPNGGVLRNLDTGLERETYTIPLYAAKIVQELQLENARLHEQLRMSKESEECHAFNARTANAAYVAHDAEVRRLREELKAAEKAANDQSLLAEQYRIDAEAAEAKLKALDEQEPEYRVTIVLDDGYTANGKLTEPLYREPIPPVDVQELQRELDAEKVYSSMQFDRIAELERKLAERQAGYAKLFEFAQHHLMRREFIEHRDGVAGREELNTLLAKAREEAIPDGWQVVPKELLGAFPEINPANYGDDEVMRLNQWGISVVLAATPKPEVKPEDGEPGKDTIKLQIKHRKP